MIMLMMTIMTAMMNVIGLKTNYDVINGRRIRVKGVIQVGDYGVNRARFFPK